jgi:nitrogen fixation protein FixH
LLVTKGFTGRHMAGAMIAFFGVVIGVNAIMATEAARTFGGTTVENSYVASQRFNTWLGEAKAQRRLGWTARLRSSGNRVVVATIPGALVTGIASHPLGRLPERQLRFLEKAPGRYIATGALPSGRWRVHLDVKRHGKEGSFLEDVAL